MHHHFTYLVNFLPKARIFANNRWILLLLAALICSSAGYFSKKIEFTSIPPKTGQTLTCKTGLQNNSATFSVYVTDSSIAQMALNRLCDNKIIKRQFGQVSVILGQSDYDTFRYINHGVVDLALIKRNVVDAFGADQIYGLTLIASHPNYSAYFISQREKPILEKEYLLGKRIGLLDYPSSRSGHIVPKTVLQNLGLTENIVDIRYYNSHKDLRRALLAGEVDIISSYWAEDDEDILSKNYATPLLKNVTGMQWFLKMQMQNTDLFCAMQTEVKDIAESHPRPYYKTLILVKGCSDND